MSIALVYRVGEEVFVLVYSAVAFYTTAFILSLWISFLKACYS